MGWGGEGRGQGSSPDPSWAPTLHQAPEQDTESETRPPPAVVVGTEAAQHAQCVSCVTGLEALSLER